MNSGSSLNVGNDIIREPNFIQLTNFSSPDNFIEPNNTNLNSELINSSSNKIASENNDHSEENDDQNQKKHLKRRSKKEVEGRNYICKICSKSYLSYPALYTHYKQKHNTNNSLGRNRGRPKKETLHSEDEKNKYNPTNETFFLKEDKVGKTDPQTEINECVDKAFNELYDPDKKNIIEERNIKFYENVDDHPFLSKFKKDVHDTNKISSEENQFTDIVLIEYLNKMSTFCNPQYYVKLIKFVTLFREHVNLVNHYKLKDNEQNKEFTECNDAEDVPDSSNEFITEFLDPEGRNQDLGYSKEECIDLTQNLCFWMYDNNFTCSKLSLLRNEK